MRLRRSDRHPMTGNRMSSEEAAGVHGFEHHTHDVVVIGAGGAGLRAAIAAHEAGARTAIVCKSLLGKAHTVMAEGGIAAAMGNRWPEDNWEVHFRDTMRGGKMLNNWRMAQLHAQEAPERVQELEDWGAHLHHGIWSSLQTMGFTNSVRQRDTAKRFGLVLALIITIGFSLVPVFVLAGVIDK